MDAGEYWQENKRFLSIVGGGFLVFLIGLLIVNGLFGSEVRDMRSELRRNQSKLRTERYTSADLKVAREQNEALQGAVEELAAAIAFVPRTDFLLRPEEGSASSQYFGRVDRVREELATLASRGRVRLPEGLGLEALMTTREEVIVRHLEALDVVDRAIRLAVEAGVERVDRIQVRLDPALTSRGGPGKVERTRVTLALTSAPEPVVRFLALSQSGRFGQTLAIEDAEIARAASKRDEVRAEITFLVVRLHTREPEDAEI